LGKYDLALKDFDEAAKLDSRSARIFANRGVLKLRLGRTEEAQIDFQRAVELDPSLKDKLEALVGDGKPPSEKR
jgi:tetratricopeptide (TPR) repeat protein